MRIIGVTAEPGRGGEYLVQLSDVELRRLLGLKWDAKIPPAGVNVPVTQILDAAAAVVDLRATIDYHVQKAAAAIETVRGAADAITKAVEPAPPPPPPPFPT